MGPYNLCSTDDITYQIDTRVVTLDKEGVSNPTVTAIANSTVAVPTTLPEGAQWLMPDTTQTAVLHGGAWAIIGG